MMENASTILSISTICAVLFAAGIGGFFAYLTTLPLIFGYIGAGILISNIFGEYIDKSIVDMISEVGVTLLMFTLGVEFSFHRLRNIIKTIGTISVIQIVGCFSIFFLALMVSGIAPVLTLTLAFTATYSSTSIVVKVLSERGELDSIPGELTTSWLVIQDLSVVPLYLVYTTIVPLIEISTPMEAIFYPIIVALVKSVLLILFVVVAGRPIITGTLTRVAKTGNRELFTVMTVLIVLLAAVGCYSLGLSAAVGAFIAGLLISETSQNHAIFSEVRPLRDIFAAVFFVSLGMTVTMKILVSWWGVILLTSLFLMLVKFLFVYISTRLKNYHKKTAFLVALGLLPMSEFAFIIGREGERLGVITSDVYGVLVAVILTTIALGSVILSKGYKAYYRLKGRLGRLWLTIFGETHEEENVSDQEYVLTSHVILCGHGRVGRYIARAFEMLGIPYVVIDYNNTAIAEIKQSGTHVIFGDPADVEILTLAGVARAKALVIAIPDRHTQEMIIGNALTANRKIEIICRTHHEGDQKYLKSLGVTMIVQPEFEASLSILDRLLPQFGITKDNASGKIARLKIEHGVG